MRKVIGIAMAAGALASTPAPARQLPRHISAAAGDPARAQDVAVDARRHGPEILAFAGVRPGAKVIDLIPGAGYWTRLFAKAVGPNGHVYGIWPRPYAAEARSNVTDYQSMTRTPAFRNVSLSVQPATTLAAPEKVDLVFTAQNYHDYNDPFMGSVGTTALAKAAFAALKPGGTFLVIDHAAAPGSGMRDTDTLHRIDPAIVRQQVTAAGFQFAAASTLLANPADDHSRKVFDPSLRGHTDQFIFRFRKPG